MINSELYLKTNNIQRRDSSEILDEFSHLFNWRYNEMNNLLDIGCGPGDVLSDIVQRKIPENCKFKITGVDISEVMIRCAREKFGSDFVEFKIADCSSISLCKQLNYEQFDNITSFFCLNWIQNQEQTFTNIFQLLRHSGTAIICFVTHTTFYDIFEILAKFKKYKKYLNNVTRFMTPYRNELQPVKLVENHCERVGLKLRHIELRDKFYPYENIKHLQDAIKAINPFTDHMPEELQTEFMNDYVKLAREFSENFVDKDEKILFDYQLLIGIMNK